MLVMPVAFAAAAAAAVVAAVLTASVPAGVPATAFPLPEDWAAMAFVVGPRIGHSGQLEGVRRHLSSATRICASSAGVETVRVTGVGEGLVTLHFAVVVSVGGLKAKVGMGGGAVVTHGQAGAASGAAVVAAGLVVGLIGFAAKIGDGAVAVWL